MIQVNGNLQKLLQFWNKLKKNVKVYSNDEATSTQSQSHASLEPIRRCSPNHSLPISIIEQLCAVQLLRQKITLNIFTVHTGISARFTICGI